MNSQNDISPFVINEGDEFKINLFVDNVNCGGCIKKIEDGLKNHTAVTSARVNMSTKRVVIKWTGEKDIVNSLVSLIENLGYPTRPFDPHIAKNQNDEDSKEILKALGVAGFAAGNIMLFSFALWTSDAQEMGQETRNMFHWLSALIAMPTIVYSGRVFFKSALNALKNKTTNMDVPISIALIITTLVSFNETLNHKEHAYFDSAIMLLFFLLIGRYLDKRARTKAREAAERMTCMFSATAKIVEDGIAKTIKGSDIKPGMTLMVATGESIASDGIITKGSSQIDSSLITGETLPKEVQIDDTVFGGTVNLGSPLEIKVTKEQEASLLSEIIKLMEKAEQKQSRYIRIADRVTKLYTPVVHLLAFITFLYWFGIGTTWQDSLLIATTVLIITCPCAIALAVPVVQVIVSGKLFKKGIFIKSGDALEKISQTSILAIDKTGTLTLGKPELKNVGALSATQYQIAASMAQHSRHPAAKSISARYNGPLLDLEVKENIGFGLETSYQGKNAKLGSKNWCGIKNEQHTKTPDHITELWFVYGDDKPVCLQLEDELRSDAKEVIQKFKDAGIKTIMLSGDREEIVKHIATQTSIDEFYAELKPTDKISHLKRLTDEGYKVLMVGDGLNDAPALAEAFASISPSSAMDITQNTSSVVFQGEQLMPIFEIWQTAKKSQKLVKQNIALSMIYNVIAVPLAITGHVTPFIAAIAMSASSLIVTVNSFRVKK